jgi:signal transduction histidine kinase
MIPKRFLSLSYRAKLLLALLVVNIPIFVILSVNEIIVVRNFAFHRELDALNSDGQFLASEVTETLLEHNQNRLMEILSFAVALPQIAEVSVLDGESVVIVSTNPALIGKKKPSIEPASLSKVKGHFYLKSFPIRGTPIKGQEPKYLQINYSLEKVHADIASTILWELGIDSIEIFIILLVAWFIAGLLEKPLVEMRDVSNKMAKGDFSSVVHVRSTDVIGQLAAAFNNMASRLSVLTNNMQNEIRTATGELTKRNRELDEKRRQLEDSNKKLRELDMLKSDFVSMVSHELRTPLTSIIGFAKTLKTLRLPEEQKAQYLAIIEAEGKRLSGLVEEYLDISKIESGNFSIQKSPLDIDNLVRSSAATFPLAPPGGMPKHRIRLDLPPAGTLPPVNADAGMLKRVLFNVIDNAVKYSDDAGEIIVSAFAEGNGVVVRVRDFGAGISSQDRGRIFEKFFRGSGSNTKQKGGTGLGLAIAKGIMDAHNGKIWCDSEVGKGTTVSIFLPLSAEAHETKDVTKNGPNHSNS